MLMNRITCTLLIIGGAIYAAAGLFDTLRHFAAGMIVLCIGVIGHGWLDWRERRDRRITQTRHDVWARREHQNRW